MIYNTSSACTKEKAIVYNYGQKGKPIAYFIGRDYNNTIDNKKEEKNMAQVTGDTMIGELLRLTRTLHRFFKY